MLKCQLSDKHLTSFFNEILCWKYFLSKAFKILIFELKTIWLSNSLKKLGKPVSLCRFYLWLPKHYKSNFVGYQCSPAPGKRTIFWKHVSKKSNIAWHFKSLSSWSRTAKLNPCSTYHNCIIIAKLPLGLIFLITKIRIITILYLTVVKIKWINTDGGVYAWGVINTQK